MEETAITVRLPNSFIVEGRRPAGMMLPESTPGASIVGDYFARAAYLEAASSVAFTRLGRELEAHGAPDELVDACRSARLAEQRHARSFGRLAQQHGARPVTPKAQTVRIRPLVDVALENIVEGFVRQTYGAAVARFRARSASDFHVRRVMEEIAQDEYVHAELAFDVAIWLQSAIDPLEAAFVEDTLRHAVVALAEELDVEVDAELCARAGVPSRRDALMIWSGLAKRVWQGISERVWSAAG